ncbi:MAG: DNA polymerase III subunit gamma/tau [Rickettsiales bacterium]|nr:DNA polymerase III subunit gamma/tau [Rickettsiales bacterium]
MFLEEVVNSSNNKPLKLDEDNNINHSKAKSYLVLARKYRPSNFDELVGQEVLVRTIGNAIKNNRLHHAFILTGIRGVGKTTTARIIAKTINCLDQEAVKTAKCCDRCSNCLAISTGNHQDVFEIDGASHTGIDDIRDIIERMAYSPISAKYKVYIIDEFHMLSKNAFNGLLKTLEEPPSFVKFILATTEIKKVLPTIVSRCQRFNLRRLSQDEIANHLKNILTKESIVAEEKALDIIAFASEGSVRDSLSLLDQALAINNHQPLLTAEIVEQMLGITDSDIINNLLLALLNGDFSTALKAFENFYNYSSDINQLITDLMSMIHLITTKKLITNYSIDKHPLNTQKIIAEIANKSQLSSLCRMWQMLNKGRIEIAESNSQKMSFEMLMARISHLVALPNLEKLLLDINDGKNYRQEILHNQDSLAKEGKIDDVVFEVLRNFEGSKII